jgi:hypothetical protein
VAFHPYFPGFIPADAWEVGQAYLRAILNSFTGCILKLHKTDFCLDLQDDRKHRLLTTPTSTIYASWQAAVLVLARRPARPPL